MERGDQLLKWEWNARAGEEEGGKGGGGKMDGNMGGEWTRSPGVTSFHSKVEMSMGV